MDSRKKLMGEKEKFKAKSLIKNFYQHEKELCIYITFMMLLLL